MKSIILFFSFNASMFIYGQKAVDEAKDSSINVTFNQTYKITNDSENYQEWLVEGIQEDKFKMFVQEGEYYSKQVNFNQLLPKLDSLYELTNVPQLFIDPITLEERYIVFSRTPMFDNMNEFDRFESLKFHTETNSLISIIDSILVYEKTYTENGK